MLISGIGSPRVCNGIQMKKLLKSLIRKAGFRVSRIYMVPQSESWFVFDESCQIPYLSEIYEQFFGADSSGFLVEVGAFDGISWSNSSGLLSRGWSGLLVEPVPIFAEKCVTRYQNYPKVAIENCAISNFQGVAQLDLAGPLSTLDRNLILEYQQQAWAKPSLQNRSIKVETKTLDTLLREKGIRPSFELLIVDVEGHEEMVFQGFDIQAWKPKMLIIELADHHPTLRTLRESHFTLRKKLENDGYSIVYKDAINTIFVENNFLTFSFSDSHSYL
jgi:FkbM family methyltransferase